MNKSKVNELNTLLIQRDHKIQDIEELNKARIIKIATESDNVISLGVKSPLRPLIINAFEERLKQIETSIKEIDPDFEFE